MTRTSADISSPDTEVYRSLGLQALCQQIYGGGGCAILDLGAARGVNIEFWSRFGPSMHVADLYSSLPPPEEEAPTGEAWAPLLAIPENSRFDVILAWDLLNYLEQPLVGSLIQYLIRFCRRGTLLFALNFDRHQMPSAPTIFKIVDEEHLLYERRTSETRACPRHQPRDIQRMMKGFRTSSSFRLRNGVQEYLFEYGAESGERASA